jgi:glutamyl-tRNA reductase
MSPEKPARIFAVGINHKSSSAFLRDRLFIDEDMLSEVYLRLARASVRQAVVLSTCDRIEVQGADEDPERAATAVRDLLAGLGGSDADVLDQALYRHVDLAAVRHIFSVAASLDSQIVGEPQVLGQVKEGHRQAAAARMTGPELEAVLQAAYGAAKRVRTETSIGERAVSIGSAAVQIAGDIHGDLRDRMVLVVGLGEIGDLILRQLRAGGIERVMLTGPGRRTEREANRLGIHFLPFEEFEAGLAKADIAVSAAGTGRFLVTAEMAARALRARRHRAMLFLDGGVPADIEPGVHDLDGAFVYSLDDLERVARQGLLEREAVAAEALEIVDAEVERWRNAQSVRDVVPTLVALRERFEAVRAGILTEHGSADAEEATRLLVNRLLDVPTRSLRKMAAESDVSEELLRRLFGLDADDRNGR